MTVLDAHGLIAALSQEPAAADVEPLLASADTPTRIASVNLAEVIDVMARLKQTPPDETVVGVNDLVAVGALQVVPVDEGMAVRAGTLRSVYYSRDRDVSMADCIALALAESVSEPLATPDPELASMARAEGVDVVALPDSSGTRP